jgi:hypothetical protein
MIDHAVFYDRRDNYCLKCEHWKGACLRGHQLASPAGCPLKKFEPVGGADYAPDSPQQAPAPIPGGKCCSSSPVEELKVIGWSDVLSSFATAMVAWVKSGAALVDSAKHGQRYDKCKVCPSKRYEKFYCRDCLCICYLKTKLATEKCPRQHWD